MLAKRLQVKLPSWYQNNYSESRSHDHELELYLWFDARVAYKLLGYAPSDVVPKYGFFGLDCQPTLYPEVVGNTFKVRLVAIERDAPDPDDVAKSQITIDLDRDPPLSTWKPVAADQGKTDLNIEINFQIETLSYIVANDIPDPNGSGLRLSTRNDPYPWGEDVRVFEPWLGLGRSQARGADPARKIEEKIWFITTFPNGHPGKPVVRPFRYSLRDIALPNDTISSVYIPHDHHVTLYEHDFSDPNFRNGKVLRLNNFGLYDLAVLWFNDMVSAIDVTVTEFVPDASVDPN